jgi:hypothetical protein
MMTYFDELPKMISKTWEGLSLSRAFEIVIKGTLSEPVFALIDGFQISRIEHGLTHLVGLMPDQPKLQGLLTLLGNLNIELVSVNPLSEKDGNHHERISTDRRPRSHR